MNLRKIFRSFVFLLLAAWSVSSMAQHSYSVKGNHDQSLVISQSPEKFRTLGYPLFIPYSTEKHEVLAIPATGRLSFNWRFEMVPANHVESWSQYDNRQATQLYPSPAINLYMSGSSIEFYRKGLRFRPRKSSLYFDLSYRNLNRSPNLQSDQKSDPTRTRAIRLGIGFTF